MLKMSSQQRIEKASELIANNATNFMHYFRELMGIFTGHIDEESLTKLQQIWMVARKLIRDGDMVHMVGHYFLQFREPILNQDDEYMMSYDYETLIVSDCVEKTKNLIRHLVSSIKSVYRLNDPQLNIQVRSAIINITECAIIHERLVKVIDN